MKRYKIRKTVQADKPDGTSAMFEAGLIVTEADIHAGCLETLVRLKKAEEYVEPPAAKAAPPSISGPMKPLEVKADHGAPDYDEPGYDEMTVEQLHKAVTERDIEGRSALTTKADLIRALEKDDKAKAKAKR